MSLSPEDALKLSKILGMLSSSHDGERAAAGAKATAFMRERGLQWQDVIATELPPKSKPKPKPKPEPKSPMPPQEAREKLDFARRHFDRLTPWEQSFVTPDRWYAWKGPLSPRQAGCLDVIVEKLRAMGMRP